MSKDSLARYYQKSKKTFKKRLMKGIKIFLKKRKTESENMVANDIKISLNMKSKDLLSTEKDIVKFRKIKPLHK